MRFFKLWIFVLPVLFLTAARVAAAQEWDDVIVKQNILEMAVTQCLEEVVFPQNYTSASGEEEMDVCLQRKGVVAIREAGQIQRKRNSTPAQEDSYEIPDIDRLVRNLEADRRVGTAPQTAEKTDPPVQDPRQEAGESFQGRVYVPSSKGVSGEGKAKPVFLNR